MKNKKDVIEKLIDWCAHQMVRWGKANGDNKSFHSGVRCGYGWMKQHLKHIKQHKKCRCPK